MSTADGQPPPGREDTKPPKLNWQAAPADRFFDAKFSHWVEIVLTLALVGIGVLQFEVYKRQAGIMEEQNQITMRQLQATQAAQRPLVHLSTTSSINYSAYAARKDTAVFLSITNDGESVPSQLLLQSGCNATGQFQFSAQDNIDIGPKESVTIRPCLIAAGTTATIAENKSAWYLFGQIKYSDAFATPYLSEFCRQVHFEPIVGELDPIKGIDTATGQPPGNITFCDRQAGVHNCTDRGCQDWSSVYPSAHDQTATP